MQIHLGVTLVCATLWFLGSVPYPTTKLMVPVEDVMSLQPQQVIAAQVVLRAASGKAPGGYSIITAENLKEFAPSEEAAARVKVAFSIAGFETGPLVGNSFSITAPAGTFEKVFQTELRYQEHGGIESVREDGSTSLELPLGALPPSIASSVASVTFTPPPDFGPTRFGP
jgi:hypothetical protein